MVVLTSTSPSETQPPRKTAAKNNPRLAPPNLSERILRAPRFLPKNLRTNCAKTDLALRKDAKLYLAYPIAPHGRPSIITGEFAASNLARNRMPMPCLARAYGRMPGLRLLALAG